MQLTNVHTNPFALLMTPDAVFAALEKSDCLRTFRGDSAARSMTGRLWSKTTCSMESYRGA